MASDVDWIVDTGASDHMTSHVELLHDVQQLSKPILVCLPDGSVKSVHQTGSLFITPQLLLKPVLVVPDFRQNLLSVGRLLDTTNLVITFFPHVCLFQDHSSKVTLGTAGRKHGLYWFKQCQTCQYTPTDVVPDHSCSDSLNASVDSVGDSKHCSIDVIHARLGHSSMDKMKHVVFDSTS
ncbi:hypothetical protein RND81_04G187300 [Saponaria officinalis]|uniref:Retrovirus-related Pol polyprotein from transposon TNT 1-94-like beta-barrel domain-containing protein n=1 Tax=Saponaria officinalis TaxID=3572 RepID=A0AAW1LNN6_SAPOF